MTKSSKTTAMSLVFNNAKEVASKGGKCPICSKLYKFSAEDCANLQVVKIFQGKNFDQKMQVFFRYQDAKLAKKNKCLIASVNIDASCLDWAEEGDYLDPSKLVFFQRMADTGRKFLRVAFHDDAIIEKEEVEKTLDWDIDEDVPY